MKKLLNKNDLISVSDNDKKKLTFLYHKILPITLSMESISLSSTFYSIPLFLKARPNKLPKNEPILLRARLYHGVFYYYY